MKIQINSEDLDFTLDREESCLDVIDSLSTWLEGQDFFISEISLDGMEFFVQNRDKLQEISVDSVSQLSILALDSNHMCLKDLETVISYFELYERALKENNKEVMVDLGSQYDSIRSNLPSLLKMNNYVFDSNLNKIMDQSGILTGAPLPHLSEDLLIEWSNLHTLLLGRIGEISTPSQEGIKTVKTLNRLIPRLEDVSILFQSGKDKEAFDIIIVLSELLSKSIRILASLSEKNSTISLPENFMNDLNVILKELAGAIDTGDTILTGDLTEYEIVPKIELLETIFNKFAQKEQPC